MDSATPRQRTYGAGSAFSKQNNNVATLSGAPKSELTNVEPFELEDDHDYNSTHRMEITAMPKTYYANECLKYAFLTVILVLLVIILSKMK
jgi:hypothetical protein